MIYDGVYGPYVGSRKGSSVKKMKRILSLFLILAVSCSLSLMPLTAFAEGSALTPTVDELAEGYFREVSQVEVGTAGASLKQAIAACRVVQFACDHALWETEAELPTLRENLLSAWLSLSEEEQKAFDEMMFGTIAPLLQSAFEDYTSVKELFIDAGVGGEMDAFVADEKAQQACSNLIGLTATMGNSDADEPEEAVEGLDFSEAGLTLVLPEDFEHAKGLLLLSPYGEVASGSGVYQTMLLYLAMTADEYTALASSEDITDEMLADYYSKLGILFDFICIEGGKSPAEVQDLLGVEVDEAAVREITTVDGYSHYLFMPDDPDYPETIGSEYAEEFSAFRSYVEDILEASAFFAPIDPMKEFLSRPLSFETTDIDGNSISSAELFAGHRVTMINVWTSWCPPCIRELPELEALSRKFEEKGGCVIGYLDDGDDPSAVETAKGLMADNGVTYPVILPPEGSFNFFSVSAYPTTFFVDSEGNFIADPIVGADPAEYETVMTELLG